jgi:hypothetical protein
MPEHPAANPDLLGSGSQEPATEPRNGGGDIHPEVQRSQAAFRRDLPQLLRQRNLLGRWVAYRGTEQIGIARPEDQLYEECARRGFQDHEYVIRCIVPEIAAEVDAAPPFAV